MENLKNLEIHNANFGNLTDYHFGGLTNLERLSLDGCKFQGFSDMLFGNLTSLRSLSLAYTQTREPIEMKQLQSQSKLESLDLTYATLNLSSVGKYIMYTR